MTKLAIKLFKCIHQRKKIKHRKSQFNFQSNEYFKLSRFELLPDEILIEIFEYLPLTDLYSAFVNLNFRLNFLLRQSQIGFYLYQNESVNGNLLRSLFYFQKQLRFLHIDHNPLINLQIFSNLKSLTIYLPTKDQLLQINNRILPNLNRLSLGMIHRNDRNLILKSLFGENKLLKLKYCYFYEIDFNETIHSYEYSYNITNLSIKHVEMKDFLCLLSLLPNVCQFDVSITDLCLKSFQNLTKFSHRNLRILKMEFVDKLSGLNHLSDLISFVPFVEQLTLVLINLVQLKDYLILENIFLNHCLQLKQFICSIDYDCQLSSNQLIHKFNQFKTRDHSYQTIQIIPCQIHDDQCLRKIFLNKILTPIY